MADKTYQIKVAKGLNGIDTETCSSPPSQSSHHQEGSLRSVESQVFLPACPPKETFSEFYQRRQKNELKRLYRHTHPELMSMKDVIDEELEDMLSSEPEDMATSSIYQGEVQSMRWRFENWTKDDSHHSDPHTTEEIQEEKTASDGGDVKASVYSSENHKPGTNQFMATAKLSVEDHIRGDVHKTVLNSGKQRFDTLKRPDQYDAGMEVEQRNGPILAKDVKGTSPQLKSTALDCTHTVEDHSFGKVKAEIQEERTDEVKTLNLFKAVSSCVPCDSCGTMQNINPTCNKDRLSSNVRTQRWSPSEAKSAAGVQIFQSITSGEDLKNGVDRDRHRCMNEGQALNAFCHVPKKDKCQGPIDTVEEVNFRAKLQLLETQPLDTHKEELPESENPVSKVDIVGVDVRSILQPVGSYKDSNEFRCWEKVPVSGDESEPAMGRKLGYEPSSLFFIRAGNTQGESARSACGIETDDMKSYKHILETIPQRNPVHSVKGSKKHDKISASNNALFQATPFKDQSGTEEGKISLDVNSGGKIFHSNSGETQSEQTSTFCSQNEKMASTHETQTDKWVMDEQSSDLQSAMMKLRKAVDEARSKEHAVQERQCAASDEIFDQPYQALPPPSTGDDGWRSGQDTDSDFVIKGHLIADINVLEGYAVQQPVDKEEIVKNNFQAALRSLEKSNINISKGGFRAAMLYRNSGKSSVQKNKKDVQTVCKKTAVGSVSSSHAELSPSAPGSISSSYAELSPSALGSVSSTHAELSPSAPRSVSSTHAELSPSAPGSVSSSHAELSPSAPGSVSSSHAELSPSAPGSVSSTHAKLSPSAPGSVCSSHAELSPSALGSVSSSHTELSPFSSTLPNQSQNPLPLHPKSAKQKPAIPPKPDHLKNIPCPVTRSIPVHKKGLSTQSKFNV